MKNWGGVLLPGDDRDDLAVGKNYEGFFSSNTLLDFKNDFKNDLNFHQIYV